MIREIVEDKGRVRPVVEGDFQCDDNGNSTKVYEILSIVGRVDNNTKLSYISKKLVPIGIPLTDTDYWYPFQVIAIPKGDKGDDGKSAYDLYIEHGGTIRTVEEWLESLNGADGKDGVSPILRVSTDGMSIEISTDSGSTWLPFVPDFNKLRVIGYIDSLNQLPKNAQVGDIYGVWESKPTQENPEAGVYRLYINTVKDWVLDYTITKVYDYDTELPSSATDGTAVLVPVKNLTLDKEKVDGYKVYRYNQEIFGWTMVLNTAEIYAEKADIINYGDNVYALVQGSGSVTETKLKEETLVSKKNYCRIVNKTKGSLTLIITQDSKKMFHSIGTGSYMIPNNCGVFLVKEGNMDNIIVGQSLTDPQPKALTEFDFMPEGFKPYYILTENVVGDIYIANTGDIPASEDEAKDAILVETKITTLLSFAQTYELYKRVVNWVYFGTNASITYHLVQNVQDGSNQNILSGKTVKDAINAHTERLDNLEEGLTNFKQEVKDTYGEYVDSPEFVRAVTDKEGKILYGVQKDSNFYFGAGCPKQVKAYIQEKLDDIIGVGDVTEKIDTINEMIAFFDEISHDVTLMDLLNKKVDKEEGKSLINKNYADNVTYIENPEFVYVKLDSEGKILYGVYRNGNFVFGAGVPEQIKEYFKKHGGELIHSIEAFLAGFDGDKTLKEYLDENYGTYEENPNFVEVKLDANGCILYGVQKDGNFYFGKGVPQQIIDYITKESAETGKYIDNPVYVSIVVDGEGKILEARRIDGRKVINTDVELAESSNIRGKVQYEETASIEKGNNPEWASLLMDNEGKRMIAGFKTDGEFVWFKGVPKHLQKVFNYAWGGSHDYNIITVKKDGTGDFTNIQEAINSIKDASVTNQYEVQVFDDYYINDLTELWEVHNPTVHSSSEPDVFVSYITTKDFVHLRGIGGKREIYVESPDINMPGRCFKNIHPIFVKGSCKIENFVFKLKGGRYAIHQDMSAYKYGVDSFKTSIYVNIDAIHYGNSMYTNGSGWTDANAQANGFANGQTQIYINVNWIAYDGNNGFYGHTNDQYTLPSKLYFINCKCLSLGSLKTPSSNNCCLEDRYSCQNNEIYIWGCDFPRFSGRAEGAGAINDNFMNYAAKKRGTKRYCLNTITGSNNKPMVVGIEEGRVLSFITKNESEKIDVIGGTAKDDIWGLTFKKIEGTGINGVAYGGNYITPGIYSQVHNLSYILGNCRNNPKTLIVRLTDSNNNSTDYTIMFDENYMTEDGSDYSYNTTPYISQSSIISTINETFGDYFTIGDRMEIIDTFIDCKETVINGGNNAIKRGMAVVRNQEDGFRSWRRANGDENPDGFAMVDIGINGYGEVLLKKKNLFHINVLNIQSVSAGNYYKVGNNGFLTQTNDSSEAIMIAIENNVLSNFKNN